MIAQVLNRDFVLEQLDLVQYELQRPPDQRRDDDDLPVQPSTSDIAAASEELRQAKERERARAIPEQSSPAFRAAHRK